jgi:uncharacterized protein (DUF1015 family)
MAFIKPFKAIRPTPEKASKVASQSLETYSKQEIKDILQQNKDSFLQIILPDFGSNSKLSSKNRYKEIQGKILEFIEDGILIQDPKPCFYLYKIEKEDFSCCGIFCATQTEDYRNNIIKRHESTIEKREKLFANYLEGVGFKAEPVLMIYPDRKEISEIIKLEIKKSPEYHFKSSDLNTHTLWKISNPETIDLLKSEFDKINAFYIADGHHRCASTNRYSLRRKRKNLNHTGAEAYNYIMSYLLAESEVKIYEFNRMVKDLNGLTKETFLKKLETYFNIYPKGNEIYKPQSKDHFSMYLDGTFYSLHLKTEKYEYTDPLSELDTQILYKTILEPILGITDLRNDKRIKYGFGKNNIKEMKDGIDRGKYKVGFSLLPLTVKEIKDISDAGLVMPPKSSYIEPKLRSGLTIYKL